MPETEEKIGNKSKSEENEGAEEGFLEKHEFHIVLLIFVFFISSMILFAGNLSFARICGDGAVYDSCSANQPYYCASGSLVEKASICGCSNVSFQNEDMCVSSFETEPEERRLNYTLDGEARSVDFFAYNGLVNWIDDQSRSISYQNGQKPNRTDFELKVIDNEQQRELLLPLVASIQDETDDKTEQARIAISLVQHVPYRFSNKSASFIGRQVNYSRYPYEVLYDYAGICGEKSTLLAFLLRELGYGTVLFYHQQENHEAVGIKCPLEESYRKTGYCFIETTGPAILSDDGIIYVGNIRLESEPEVIFVSEGQALPHGLEEYRDAEIIKSIRNGQPLFFKNYEMERLREEYGLVEEYRIE